MAGTKQFLKKTPVILGITLASFSNLHAQENNTNTLPKEDPKTISVDSAKKIPNVIFEEDSNVVEIPSVKYLDLNAVYYKEDSNNYVFHLFMDKEGNQKDPEAQLALIKEWKEKAEEGWAEKEAKKIYDESQNVPLQLEKELKKQNSTIEEKKYELDNFYNNVENFYKIRIESAQDSVEEKKLEDEFKSGSYDTFNKEKKELEEEIIGMQNADEYFETHPEELKGKETYDYWYKYCLKQQEEARKNLAGDYWLKDFKKK